MSRLRKGVMLLSVALCVSSSWLPAEPDPAQLAWLNRQGAVQHWDNIEGAPEWLDGPAPHYSYARRRHEVTLQPGESVRIRIPAREQLRIASAGQALHPADVEVEWSNGSGLYVPIPVHFSEADGSLLTAAGDSPGTGTLRVTRPVQLRGTVMVALFSSRRADPVTVASYRNGVDIPALSGAHLADRSGMSRFQLLQGGQSVTVPVQGARRYRLESRVVFPPVGETTQQDYRITTLLDGNVWRVFEFESVLDSGYPLAVDRCYTTLGRQVDGYLETPAGARQLELHSTLPVYLRLEGQPPNRDFLWAGNRPPADPVMQPDATLGGSIWDLSAAQLASVLETDGNAGLSGQQAVQRLLQDNRWRDGGLTGSALARRGPQRYPDYPELRQQSELAWSLHTFYRDLLPAAINVNAGQQFSWFRIPVVYDASRRLVVPESYAQSLASQLAGGYFLEVPAGAQHSHEYRVPPRAAATQLRVSVLRSSVSTPTPLYLQFDDAPPRRLQVMPSPDFPAEQWQPDRAEAALAVTNHLHGARGQSLAGPFAVHHGAAPLLDAGFIELPMPRETQRVRIWRDPEQGASLRLALQYRASRPYQLAGTGYQALLQAVGPEAVYQQLLESLSGDSEGGGARQAAAGGKDEGLAAWHGDRARDLDNQWLPLLRLLHGRHDILAASLQTSREPAAGGGQLTAAKRRTLRQSAAQASAAGDPVAALGAWTALWRGSNGKLRDEAALARVSLLEQLGEAYLAEQQLRVLLFDATSEATRAQALERLLARYRRAGDDEAVLTILAAAAVRNPTPATLRELAYSLHTLGKTEEALQLALALPAAEQPRELLLEGSYAAGWWSLFQTQLDDIRETSEFHQWAGLQAQAAGDYTGALAHWEQGGASTARLRQHLSEGLAIRRRLGAADAGVRRAAVQDWEQWQSRHPGPSDWQPAPQLVTRYAGADMLYSPGQDSYSIAFRATPAVPVMLQVHGPVTLRIGVRGLHPATAGKAYDDWVSVADGNQQALFPVTDNRPAHGLQLSGNDRELPGLEESFEYRVAPGPHEIRIAPEHAPLVLQLAASGPRLPLSVLPPLTAASVQAALQGNLGPALGRPAELAEGVAIEVLHDCDTSRLVTAAAADYATPAVLQTAVEAATGPASVIPNDTGGSARPVPSITSRDATSSPETVPSRGPATPADGRTGKPLSLASATPAAATAQRQPANVPLTSAGVQVYVVSRGDTLSEIAEQTGIDLRQLAALNAIGPPYKLRVGRRLQLGTSAGPTVAAAGSSDGDAVAVGQMRQFLWLAEHDERKAVEMVANGEALYQQHTDVPGLQRLLQRLRRAATWELLPAVQASAGLRVVEVPPGLPEHPGTRTRIALLPELRPGEQWVSGVETLVLAVDQPAAAVYRIDLRLAELTAAPSVPMQVQLQLDDGPARQQLLTPAEPGQTSTQPVPSGNHLLRVRIIEPVLNQFLRVFIREQGRRSGSPMSIRAVQRTYHVASRDEPVVVDVEGPTRLRIDELREGYTLYTYRDVAAGWQRLQIEAAGNRDQALLRIHRLTARQAGEPLPARQSQYDPLPVPSFTVAEPAPVQPERPAIDLFPLGGQEDGSWSLTTALVERRNLDEDRTDDNRGEKFTELRATHRFFAADKDTYFRTDLLTRQRDNGGPTLGLLERVDIRRPDWPFDVPLRGSLYLQRPDSAAGTQWAASLRAGLARQFELTPKLSHRPSIGIFQRWLSLSDKLEQHAARVDQDVFTRYKHDHRRGLDIGETLGYSPWLDTRAYLSLGLVSNSDLNPFDPDHVSAKLGASQLLGNWQVSAEYVVRRYFQDDDRNHSLDRQRTQLALDWFRWRSEKRGLQAQLLLDWDKTSGDYSGLASFTWHWSNARFYRDFSPNELDFKPLRRRQLDEQLFSARPGDNDG